MEEGQRERRRRRRELTLRRGRVEGGGFDLFYGRSELASPPFLRGIFLPGK